MERRSFTGQGCSGVGSFEGLEPRLLLSGTVYLVDSIDDVVAADGNLTLREAIEAANANAAVNEAPAGSAVDTDVINFAAGLHLDGPITLNGVELAITDDLRINGDSNGERMWVHANRLSRVFSIPVAVTVEFNDLIIAGGYTDGHGADINGYLGSVPQSLPGATVILNRTLVSGGLAGGNAGGVQAATVVMSHTVVSYNTAGNFGGVYGYDVTLEDSIIAGNSAAGSSGGVFGSSMTLINSVVVGNTAGSFGGGVYGGDVTLVNSTVTANAAGGSGGGLYIRNGSAEIVNSIVSLNDGGDVYGPFAMSHSLVGVEPHFVANPDDGGDGWGDDPDIPGDAELLNDDFGDLTPADNSAAIDFGDTALALDAQGSPLSEDIRYHPRVFGASVDAGAVERQSPTALVKESPSATVTTAADAFDIYDGAISLREALWYVATGQVAGATVAFDPALSGQSILLDGQLRIDADTTVDASALDDDIVIDAQQNGRAVLVSYGVDASLTHLTLTGGYAVDGGAIWVAANGGLTLDGVTLDANEAAQYGGAIFVGANGSLSITDATVSGNVSGGSGGGLYVGDDSTVAIAGSQFTGNVAGAFSLGGAIAVSQSALTVSDTVFSGNAAGWSGGAIDLWSTTLRMTDSFIHGNNALNGGGISALYGDVKLTDVLIAGNRAEDAGGGLYLYHATLAAANAILVGNAAASGGGLYSASQSAATLNHATVTFNDAASGAGIESVNSTLTLNNTIAALNTTGADVLGAFTNHSSLIGVDPLFFANPSDGGDGWGDDPATGGTDEGANDDFGDLRLTLASSAIDFGDDAYALDVDGGPLDRDYRGGLRKVRNSADAGAYEFQYMAGDANGDETVDILDFVLLKQNYGTTTGATWQQGDFNFDGAVDILDFVLLKQNYGKSFTPPA